MSSGNGLDYLKAIGIWGVLIFATYAFWKWYAGYLWPFGLGLFMALALEPLVKRLKAHNVPPTLAVMTSLALGVGTTVAALALIITVVTAQLIQLSRSLPAYFAQWQGAITGHLARLQELRAALGITSQTLHGQLGTLYRLAEALLRSVLGLLLRLPDFLIMVVVAMVAAFFLLRDWRRLAGAAVKWIPPPLRPRVFYFKQEIIAGALGFLTAQLTLIGTTAVAAAAGLWLIQAPYAVLLGVVAGLLDLVPFLGPTALLAPWAVVELLSGHRFFALRLVAVLFGVAFIRQVLEPRLVGGRTGLHPLVVLFSLYIAVRIFGGAGFVIGPISAIVLKAATEAFFQPLDPVPPGRTL